MINYSNKLILAPMVRGSKLPMRLLALKYGADLVYTDELIDISMLMSKRKVNEVLGTVDYVNEANGYVSFRMCPTEKEKLIFQMGTANPTRAVAVAKMVQNDVSAIDVNMGCPKPYSTDFGMGSALLSRPHVAKDILRDLVKNIPLPITCKIRIYDNIDESIKLVKEFENIGISAIAVHGRTRSQKSTEPVNKDAIRQIAESVRIPVIANGGSNYMHCFEDIEKFKKRCGVTSVMIARAAQKNVSIFRKEGIIPIDEVIPEYLRLSIDYDNSLLNTKYAITKFHKYNDNRIGRLKFGRRFEEATEMSQICEFWGLKEYCLEKHREYATKGHKFLPCSPQTAYENMPEEILDYRKTFYDDPKTKFSMMTFNRKYFSKDSLPKVILNNYAVKNKLPKPIYETKREDRLYYSVLTYNGEKYSSLVWDRDKKFAEQNAALVCAHRIGLIEEDFLLAIGSLLEELPLDDSLEYGAV